MQVAAAVPSALSEVAVEFVFVPHVAVLVVAAVVSFGRLLFSPIPS